MSSSPRLSIALPALLIAAAAACAGGGCSGKDKPGSDAATPAGNGGGGGAGPNWHSLVTDSGVSQGGSGGAGAGAKDAGSKPNDAASGGGDGGEPPSVRVDPRSIRAETTWPVCRLLAPSDTGVGGTDLGFSVPAPIDPDVAPGDERLIMLFGDTWARPMADCRFAPQRSDDLQGTLPARRAGVLRAGEPTAEAASACDGLSYAFDRDDLTSSWRALRLFPDAGERSPDKVVDTTFLRTPVTGFSDGQHTYAMILRNDPAYCGTSSECPSGAYCSTESAERAPGRAGIGTCPSNAPTASDSSPAFCVMPSTCDGGARCAALARGICLAEAPYTQPGADGPLAPPWFDDDPRRAIVRSMFIAVALWPDRPEDYALGYTYATHRFYNSVARAVAHFDPRDPSANDYRPGTETLLMWGRPAFFSSGGAQSQLFFSYQPLAGLLGDDGTLHWDPRYFAGYGDDGMPRWSASEGDAQPVYGGALARVDGKVQVSADDTEFDEVNHDAITWVEPLQRWVLLYGGSVPDWIREDTATGEIPAITHPQPAPGQVHMRTAAHPWGRATKDAPADEAWTLPVPLAGPAAAASLLSCAMPDEVPETGCGVPRAASAILADIVDWTMTAAPAEWQDAAATCVAGNAAFSALYQLAGADQPHFYGVNVIDSWTADVSGELSDLADGERAVELYWNVSTWSPYQVVLMKTQLRARVER
jgi:hypothetical protein